MIKKLLFSCLLLFSFLFVESYAKSKTPISYHDKGEGPPLILIHAFPADLNLWKIQEEKLSKYFRIITLDLWGFGNSPELSQKLEMTDYADEVNQLMEQLHIKNAVIGGESMGGYVALALLENHPDKVAGLILSGTQSIPDTKEAKAKREILAQEILKNGSDAFIKQFLPKTLSKNAPKEMQEFLLTMFSKQKPKSIAQALIAISLRKDTTNILAKTNIPVLIIAGDEDAVIPNEQSKKMAAIAKNSRLVILQGGHLINLENSDEWNLAVKKMFYGEIYVH